MVNMRVIISGLIREGRKFIKKIESKTI
jgi:hypothetical protein